MSLSDQADHNVPSTQISTEYSEYSEYSAYHGTRTYNGLCTFFEFQMTETVGVTCESENGSDSTESALIPCDVLLPLGRQTGQGGAALGEMIS